MSFNENRAHFEDILDNIQRIEEYAIGLNHDTFISDNLRRDAIERCIARVSEAAIRLYKSQIKAETMLPDVPWADIRGIGNHIRHAYDSVDATLIWNIIIRDLPSLKKSVQTYLETESKNHVQP